MTASEGSTGLPHVAANCDHHGIAGLEAPKWDLKSPNFHFHRLRRVVSQNVDHLHDHRVSPGFWIRVLRLKLDLRVFARAVTLPLVVERVVSVVPIDGP